VGGLRQIGEFGPACSAGGRGQALQPGVEAGIPVDGVAERGQRARNPQPREALDARGTGVADTGSLDRRINASDLGAAELGRVGGFLR
jgi:hypothetical protein